MDFAMKVASLIIFSCIVRLLLLIGSNQESTVWCLARIKSLKSSNLQLWRLLELMAIRLEGLPVAILDVL